MPEPDAPTIRRHVMVAALAVVVIAGVAGCQRHAASVPLRRIVLISIDTLRPDHLGAYGYARPTSPRLDALAKAGVVFEDVTSPSPWTLPAHASLLTGLYPGRHGLVSHDVTLAESVTTLATALAAQGFATGAIVNSHNLSPLFGLNRGFQQFEYVREVASQREPSRGITDLAIKWLRDAGDRRFFLFLHYYDVHSDYRSLPQYEAQFVRPYTGKADGTTAQLVAQRAGKVVLDQADMTYLIDLYDAGIRQMDDELGRLLAVLGDGQDTLVIVTSDHGEEFLEHGGVLHGRTQFEEVVRVPLIVRGPGVPPGARVATTVSSIDVMPTILAAAGVTPPAGLDGSDLTPTWHGGGAELGERYLSCEADHNNIEPDMTRAVRHHKDKLHFDRQTGQLTLFDLGVDPGEHVDTAERRPAVTTELRAQLERHRQVHADAGGAVTLTPEEMERLRSLGYVR